LVDEIILYYDARSKKHQTLRDRLLLKFLADSGGQKHGISVSHEFR